VFLARYCDLADDVDFAAAFEVEVEQRPKPIMRPAAGQRGAERDHVKSIKHTTTRLVAVPRLRRTGLGLPARRSRVG